MNCYFLVTDVIVMFCTSGSHSAETTEQRRTGGAEMEPESVQVRPGLTTSKCSLKVSKSDQDLQQVSVA